MTLDELKEDDETLEIEGVKFALSRQYKDQFDVVTIDYLEKEGLGGFVIKSQKRSKK